MKSAALLAILLWQTAPAPESPVAQPDAMRYQRAIQLPAVDAGSGQACAVLDAQIFPHAAPSLTDLRIFPAANAARGRAHELPFAITLSEAASEETESAWLLNLGAGTAGRIVFDLEMPDRAYTDVTLDLDPAVHDFLATATVSGSDTLGGKGTALGSFTLFDLSSQHLSRDTTLPLAESTFRFLHVVISIAPAAGGAAARFTPSTVLVPAMVRGAQVPPSREAQIVYTTVAETASVATAGRESVARFEIPARVPVERVSFVLAPGFKANFSRDVRVTALAEPASRTDERAPLPETANGSILRVHATEAGREIRTEELGIPAILGANLQRAAKVQVAIENGDDQPLPIAAARLEMRQRKLCFEAADAGAGSDSGLTLFYGDPKLAAPVYDYDRLFVASRQATVAQLGPERINPNYIPPPAAMQPFTERHPQLLWVALVCAICALGVVALKSARNVG
jgi:hypothetical protein